MRTCCCTFNISYSVACTAKTHLILRFDGQVSNRNRSLLLHTLAGGAQQTDEQGHATLFDYLSGIVWVDAEVGDDAGAVFLDVLVE